MWILLTLNSALVREKILEFKADIAVIFGVSFN